MMKLCIESVLYYSAASAPAYEFDDEAESELESP